MNHSLQRHSPPGFTLVEVMVAMVIALIVMGGVYRTLVDEDINHASSEKILDMQNNARVALEQIVKDVRRAGFLGCGGTLSANTLSSAGSDATMVGRLTIAKAPAGLLRDMDLYTSILEQLNAEVGVVNYLGEDLGFNDNAPADHEIYQEGTDALTLVYLSGEQLVNNGGMATTNGDVPVPTPKNFGNGDVLYITDCLNFSLFQKTGEAGGTPPTVVVHAASGLNNSDDLLKRYGQQIPARLYKLNTSTYFLHKGDFNFCRNDTDRPMASNIEDLQFEFLADENDNGTLTDDPWRSNLAAYPTGNQAVRAVRIWLLAMSDTDFTYTDNNPYDYPNSPYYSALNPFASLNGGGGSPAAQAPITSPANGEHRHRYLASAVVYLRNAGLR